MTNPEPISSYLLIDSALLHLDTSRAMPGWIIPVYDETAASVSPLVIDTQAACDAAALDDMMKLFNAANPQLHASILDTALSHAALVQHLRRFIMIRTDDGRALTLRFADCLGLPVLAAIFNAAQWASFTGPVKRWCVHGRDGALCDLPLAEDGMTPARTPLVLTAQQLDSMAEATGPDEMLANIREMRHGLRMPGSGVEQHRWASEARRLWRTAETVDRLVLRWLTTAALDTHGAVLGRQQVLALLKVRDTAAIRLGLEDAVTHAK